MIDDLLRDQQLPTLSLYEQGDFTDLCRGPHLPSTGRVGPFKLLAVAGAYWRGDAANKMLTRIYGSAFFDKKQLTAHLDKLEKARKQDHRVLGRQLELFSVHEDIGPGLIHWHPKAGLIRYLIESFWHQEHLKRGYQIVYTPHIASERIFQISGHLEKYAEMMYSPMDIDGQNYYLKPMNCPGHIRIYQTRPHSYRELPLRYCELGTVYRYEPTGTLHGMLRVRGFTQDDSHIFCTPEQLADEVGGVLELADYMLKSFGYTYSVYLATRPDNFLGTEAQWDFAIKALAQALESRSISYEIDPGGGVFYAPKIDLKVNDSLGRQWQGPTIQVDLNLPSADRFNITYVAPDNAEHEVIMIHRTVLGSMERFVGGLIEHFAGAFPLWLAPVQVAVLPVSQKFSEYAKAVHQKLLSAGLRSELNHTADTLSAKIRQATLEKIPYMLILGAKEAQANRLALRERTRGDLGTIALDEFLRRCQNEINCKGLTG
jgi:threonyl-tRNA synthetase